MSKDKKNSAFFRNWRDKYRLVIINDETFEQKTSLKLSKFNLYVGLGSLILLIVFLVVSLLAFTNLKYFLPGVGTMNFRHKMNALSLKTDSLNEELNRRNLWITNVQKIISGEVDSTFFIHDNDSTHSIKIDSIDLDYLPENDVALREEVATAMAEENIYEKIGSLDDLGEDMLFSNLALKLKLSNPVEGVVIQSFSSEEQHYGIDIAADTIEPVKAIYDGTVFLSEWNPKTGFVIGIQHPNNLISFYKHNALLLKKIGTFVQRGEAIAIVGNSGAYSTGPHLHFEIWHNGAARDPLKFIELPKMEK